MMNESELFKIISRLHAMQIDVTSQIQRRRFEKFGVEVCRVEYDHRTKLFKMIGYRPYYEAQFDNLDLAAIEIYDCLAHLEYVF